MRQHRFKMMSTKLGMSHRFDETGRLIPCTVLRVEPNVVAQVKTQERDGYTALQLAYKEIKTKDPRTMQRRVSKPLKGHFEKAGIAPRKHLMEVRLPNVDEFSVGQEFDVTRFEVGTFVDATATSKGKGFQGVIKRHHFSGGPASHGSHFHRTGGSTGMCSSPGIVLKGMKKPGRMGNERVTSQSLQVIEISTDQNIMLVRGTVPGPIGGLVEIGEAVKKLATA